MNNRKYILIIIFVLTLVSSLIALPQDYRLQFKLGNFSIDRIIKRPNINISIGNFSFKKDFSPRFGLDLSGGTHLVLQADMSQIDNENRKQAFDSATDIVEKRVNLYGLTEPIVQQSKVGDDFRIIVEIPGVTDVRQAIDLIGKTAQLTFVEEASDAAKIATPSSIFELWSQPTQLTGKNLQKSDITFNPQTGKPEVALEFDEEGSRLFAEITKRNAGKTLAIFLDDELLSAPKVSEEITGGRAVIQGDFDSEEAKRLSISLNAGALPVSLKVIQQKHIGATLGSQSIEKSMIAGAVGLFIVMSFMIYNYGLLGLVADISLIIYTLIVFALFKTIPVTLTLAGIAGFILSIGVAVDANILIFERIKEEIRWGKSANRAIALGFKRAFPSIRDSNISSLITCFILYWFGSGIVRGFAITLAVGIIVSLFSAITITRTFISMIYEDIKI